MTNKHPLSQKFHSRCDQMKDLHDAKQLDYGSNADPFANIRGSQDWGIRPWVGAMVRANDKVKRIQKFARTGSLVNESVRDSLMDLAVYSIIALVLLDEEKENENTMAASQSASTFAAPRA